MIEYLDDMLKHATTEVFSTMLSLKVQFEPEQRESLAGEMHVAGAVGFTGRFNGMIYLYSSVTFAHHLTSVLLGIPQNAIEGNEMVNDAVGEMTNMLAGMIKSRMCDRGVPCVISIPAVVRGKDFRIDSMSSTERHTAFFRCNGNQVLTEIIVKPA